MALNPYYRTAAPLERRDWREVYAVVPTAKPEPEPDAEPVVLPNRAQRRRWSGKNKRGAKRG